MYVSITYRAMPNQFIINYNIYWSINSSPSMCPSDSPYAHRHSCRLRECQAGHLHFSPTLLEAFTKTRQTQPVCQTSWTKNTTDLRFLRCRDVCKYTRGVFATRPPPTSTSGHTGPRCSLYPCVRLKKKSLGWDILTFQDSHIRKYSHILIYFSHSHFLQFWYSNIAIYVICSHYQRCRHYQHKTHPADIKKDPRVLPDDDKCNFLWSRIMIGHLCRRFPAMVLSQMASSDSAWL